MNYARKQLIKREARKQLALTVKDLILTGLQTVALAAIGYAALIVILSQAN